MNYFVVFSGRTAPFKYKFWRLPRQEAQEGRKVLFTNFL